MTLPNRTDAGAAAVEYAILLAGVAAVIIAITALIGGEVAKGFQALYDGLVG